MPLDFANWLLPATGFAVAMSLTPGPNNVMLVASGATFGLARSVPHMLGVALGFPVMLGLVALGAGGPLQHWPWLHDVLRWLGIGYMLWLAWHVARTRPAAPADPGSRPLSFLQAALFQWINPKAWVIAAGAVVTYTSSADADFTLQAAALAAIFLVTTIAAVALWAAVGAGAARVLRTRRALRAFNVSMAALLVLSLVPMVWE